MENENGGIVEDGGFVENYDMTKVYRGKFQGLRGKFITIARLIHNGLSYNLGTIDGAVTIMDDFTRWRFIAPIDRFVREEFAEMTLREVLQMMADETANVPVPAWDDFFSFLSGREDLANAAILGNSVIRVGGMKVTPRPIENCSDFGSFASWLCGVIGEAGNLPAVGFIVGQELLIPLDMYSATPVSVTLKTPTQKPAYKEDTTLWGKHSESFNDPVFLGGEYLYAFEPTTDKFGTAIPQGWSIVSEEGKTWSYTPYDMEANPVTIPIEDGSELEFIWIEMLFMDIEYDETTEVHDGTITFSILA